MGVGLALLGAHVGLWLWARRAALPAMSTALALFAGNLALTGLRDGWLVKTVTFVILSRGLLAAFRAHRLRAGLVALRS